MQTVTGGGGGEIRILERDARGRKGAWLALLVCTVLSEKGFPLSFILKTLIHPDV